MKSVIKGSYKANVGAGAGAGTIWKSQPERKQKVSAPQHSTIPNIVIKPNNQKNFWSEKPQGFGNNYQYKNKTKRDG